MGKINKIKVNGTPYEVEDKEAVKTVTLTQAEYDALQTKDPSIFYVISDGQGGGGGMTSGEVQTMIDSSISGKADSSGVTQEISAATSGKVDTTTFNTYSGAVDTTLSGKQDVSGMTAYTTTATTSALNNVVTAHTANTSIHVSAEQIAAWDAKSDFSGSYNDLTNKLSAGTNVTIVDNVISAEGGGGKAIEAGRGISITTGETAYTVSFNLPISAGTGAGSLIIGDNGYTSYASVANGLGAVAFPGRPFYGGNRADGESSFAHGTECSASTASHAEGSRTKCTNTYNSHSEGADTEVRGMNSHSEGEYTLAGTDYTTVGCHAEGFRTSAMTNYSHAEGSYTKTTNVTEHASGQYNNSVSASTTFGDSGNTLFSVGNGTANNARHNAFEIRQNGDIYISKDGQDVKLQDQLGGSGGGKAVSGGTNISITTGETADTINCTLPITATSSPFDTISVGKNSGGGRYNTMIGPNTSCDYNSMYNVFLIAQRSNNSSEGSYVKGRENVIIGSMKTGYPSWDIPSFSTSQSVVIGGGQMSTDKNNSLAIGYNANVSGTTKTNINNQLTIDTSNQVYIYNKDNTEMICLQDQLGGGGITSGEVQDMIDESVSGKVDTTTFNTYSGSVDTALSEKQDILSAGTGIDITDNTISVTGGSGGGKAVSGGTNISITTGETADTINCTLPMFSGSAVGASKINHVENVASGLYSNAEGNFTTASKDSAHAEGKLTKATGNYSHAEGYKTTASNISAHAEGGECVASGERSHAEGCKTTASTYNSHTEGYYTVAYNADEHASGKYNISNTGSTDADKTLFSVGNGTADNARHNAFEIRQNGDIYITSGSTDIKLQDHLGGGGASYSAGTGIDITNDVISVTGKADTSAVTEVSNALTAHTADTTIHVTSTEKAAWNAKSDFSGSYNDLTNKLSAGTNITIVDNVISAEGGGKAIEAGRGISITTGATADTVSLDINAKKGSVNTALIFNYINSNTATEAGATSFGYMCQATNQYTFANGNNTQAKGYYSHSEGESTIANGWASHSDGQYTNANGKASHTEGSYVNAENDYESSQGRYNVSNKANTTWGDSGNTLFSIGNGTADNARHNAFEIRQNGDIYYFDGTNDVKLQDKFSSIDTTIGDINTILQSI